MNPNSGYVDWLDVPDVVFDPFVDVDVDVDVDVGVGVDVDGDGDGVDPFDVGVHVVDPFGVDVDPFVDGDGGGPLGVPVVEHLTASEVLDRVFLDAEGTQTLANVLVASMVFAIGLNRPRFCAAVF